MVCDLHSTVFPDGQRETPLFWFVLTVACPGIKHHWVRPGSIFFISSLQVIADIDQVSLNLFISRLEHSQILTGEMLQFFSDLCSLALCWTLSSVTIYLLHCGTQYRCDLTNAE